MKVKAKKNKAQKKLKKTKIIAVENNYMALKLLVDKNFNDIVLQTFLKSDNIIIWEIKHICNIV